MQTANVKMEQHPAGTLLSIVLGIIAGGITSAEAGHTVLLSIIGGAVSCVAYHLTHHAIKKIKNNFFKR